LGRSGQNCRGRHQRDPSIDKNFSVFLSQAYNLKAVADYKTESDSLLPSDRAAAAIETAGRFVDSLSKNLAKPNPA